MKDFDKPKKSYHDSKIETVVMCWPSNASISFGVSTAHSTDHVTTPPSFLLMLSL